MDSTFLAEAAKRALGDNALAVTAVSDSYPEREMKAAQDIAKQIRIRYETINTDELETEGYASNPTNRCYFCKTELFEQIRSNCGTIQDWHRLSTEQSLTMLGITVLAWSAAKQMGISRHRSIDCESDQGGDSAKFQSVGGYRRGTNLPLRASPPVFPMARGFTRENLRLVDRAEQFLFDLGIRQFRVRHHDTLARIEVDPQEIEFNRCLNLSAPRLTKNFKSLGYEHVAP